MLTLRITALAAALALAGALHAAAPPPPPPSPADAVLARQAGFKKMGGAMKALREQLASPMPGQAAMLSAAQTIAAAAHELPPLFPAGSDAGAGVKTDALPTIWTDRATFDTLMGRLIDESGKLATIAAAGDAAAIGAQQKSVGAVCGACHHQFRAET